jgi:hypothetical protein
LKLRKKVIFINFQFYFFFSDSLFEPPVLKKKEIVLISNRYRLFKCIKSEAYFYEKGDDSKNARDDENCFDGGHSGEPEEVCFPVNNHG